MEAIRRPQARGPAKLLVATLCILVGMDSAHALDRAQPVLERARPEVEPPGMQLGSFRGYLSAGIETGYDDNIRAVPNNPEGDLVTRVEPRAAIVSQWQRHGLGLDAGARWTRHLDNTQEDHLDGDAGVEGHIDLAAHTRLSAAVRVAREHVDRAALEEPGGREPTAVNRLRARLDGQHRFTRLGLGFRASYESFDFREAREADGTTIDNAVRDRTRTGIAGRGSYQFYPGLESYVEAGYRRVSFPRAAMPGGLDRSFEAYEALVGSVFDVAWKLSGELHSGVRVQFHDDARLEDVVERLFGASLVSPLTPLTTLTAQLDHGLKDTTVPGAAGFRSTLVRLGAQHELLRHLLVEVEAGYIRDSFLSIGRLDRTVAAGAGLTYLMNRHVHLSLDYDFAKRSSSVGADFTRNRVMLGARLQY